MRRELSPARFSGGWAVSSWPMGARSSSMKSATSQQTPRMRCACSKSVSSNASVENQTIRVNVRVIAATNRDLGAAVASGSFREDLFYRLNVFPIDVPSLRERADDTPLLVEYLVARSARRAGKKIRRIEKATLDLFKAYTWPGNIRELQNVVERAVILCEGDTLSVDKSSSSMIHPDPRAPRSP